MEETYKEYKITYNENLKEFIASIGESNYQNSDLSSVKKYIDKLDSKDFKRIDVIVDDYSKMADAIVTSYPDGQTGSYKECWVSFKSKKGFRSRSKVSTAKVFLDIPRNREILTQMKEKENLIKEIKNNIQALKESLETYKPD